MHTYKVAFVILHYLVLDVTIKCIESIRTLLTYQEYQIVVVDNGSNNGSGIELEKKYKNDKEVKVICLENNLGFSAGNNVGYKYAKEHLHSEFIIVINNDTEMIQNDFVEKTIKFYNETFYYVMGPDIVHIDGIHQSPLRDHIITKGEARKWYLNRYLFGVYLRLRKRLKLSSSSLLYKKFVQHDIKRKEGLSFRSIQENVELQGACIIFSPLYVEQNKVAFEELTFMYCEEALLSLRCVLNKWKIVYNPDLKIRHAEKKSTEALGIDALDREIFRSYNLVKSIHVVLEQMRK